MPEVESEEFVEIDLREYLQVLWERKKLILGILLITLLAGWFTTYYLLDPVYETTATVKLGTHKGKFSRASLAKGLLTSTNYFQRVNQELATDYSVYELQSMAEDQLKVEETGGESSLLKIFFSANAQKKQK